MRAALAGSRNVGGTDERNCSHATSGVTSVSKAIAVRGDDNRTPTTIVGKYFTRLEAREELSAAVHVFTPRQLVKAAGCSVDAAKSWIAGTRTPSLDSIINMARSLPIVQQWLAEKCGWRAADAMSIDAVIRWAREYRKAPGMDGDVARAVLRAVAGDEPEPVVIETIVLDAWKLQDLREERAREIEERKIGAIHDLFEPRRRA